jgi:hypothetical protein
MLHVSSSTMKQRDDFIGEFVMRPRAWVWGLAIVLTGFVIPAHADVVISIGSATTAPGSTATVDVLISGTSSDLINQYGFQLQVQNNGSDNTQLAFPAQDASNSSYATHARRRCSRT